MGEDVKDPFTVGQYIGMLVVLTYIEQHGGIPVEILEKLMVRCAEQSAAYMERPAEDVHLFVDTLVKEIA